MGLSLSSGWQLNHFLESALDAQRRSSDTSLPLDAASEQDTCITRGHGVFRVGSSIDGMVKYGKWVPSFHFHFNGQTSVGPSLMSDSAKRGRYTNRYP